MSSSYLWSGAQTSDTVLSYYTRTALFGPKTSMVKKIRDLAVADAKLDEIIKRDSNYIHYAIPGGVFVITNLSSDLFHHPDILTVGETTYELI
jgi:hypothetical protein